VAGVKFSRRLLDRDLGWSPHGCKVSGGKVCTVTVGHHRKGFVDMLDKSLQEEQASMVDERLVRVVQIIVEQYDGDVKAFVESIRYRVEVNRKAAAALDNGDEAAWQHVQH